MGGWAGGIVLRALAAIVCAIAAVWLALWYFIPAPPSTITIATGIKGGAFEHIAERYQERLARRHVKLVIRNTNAGFENVGLVEDPRSGVDAAFLFGGVSSSADSPGLESLGRIVYAPIWIFYKGPETLERLTQLKGKRLNITPANRGLVVRILLPHGVTPENTTMSHMLGPPAVEALNAGDLDVVFLPPQEINGPVIQTIWRDPTIRLMNVTQAETLARLFPNLNHLVLPQGAVDLEKNMPATDVNLIATTNVVVVRKDLHPELIYLLAQTLQEEHSGAGIFQRAGEFPSVNDPEFPVAEEAIDFYKNGPSFLHRYLPFWMVNYAKRLAAILVAAIAIVIPLFTFTPKLYAWLLNLRLARLYRRLRAVETGLEGDLTGPQIEELQTDLESVNRAAKSLPPRHSDLFIALIMHINFTRTRLASRLAELRG